MQTHPPLPGLRGTMNDAKSSHRRWPAAPPASCAENRSSSAEPQNPLICADPRTTMRYDRARKNLDRHPNYILAAYMASGTRTIHDPRPNTMSQTRKDAEKR
jgi:hypothetical protein